MNMLKRLALLVPALLLLPGCESFWQDLASSGPWWAPFLLLPAVRIFGGVEVLAFGGWVLFTLIFWYYKIIG